MSVRKLLLTLGVVFVIAGLWLAVIWFNQVTERGPQTAEQEQNRPAVLVALDGIPSGTLLREGEIGWKEVTSGELRPGYLQRGQISEREFFGAITRRDFAKGEPLLISELVKPSDRRFLSAVLRPDRRAVSISVDAPQSSSGLVLPGDYVDIILTQNFGDSLGSAARRSVGETVLHNVRVVAVGQSLSTQTKPSASAGQTTFPGSDAQVPKTITLELDERQAQKLFVAMQLGKLQLAVRPLEGSGLARDEHQRKLSPTWAADVSPAIRQMALSNVGQASSGSTVESSVRRPPRSTSQ
jgi:pilus assembly protein CpaB